MTIRELIELLEDAAVETGSDETEVRLASQPNWPFEYSIHGVGVAEAHEADEEDGDDEDQDEPIVYIGEGQQLGYLSQAGREAAWGR